MENASVMTHLKALGYLNLAAVLVVGAMISNSEFFFWLGLLCLAGGVYFACVGIVDFLARNPHVVPPFLRFFPRKGIKRGRAVGPKAER